MMRLLPGTCKKGCWSRRYICGLNVVEEEVYAIIYKAIDELAPQSRKVILLSLQELSNGEIAEKLGISVNSVRTLKQNAYKKLKGLLKDYFYLLFLLISLAYLNFL